MSSEQPPRQEPAAGLLPSANASDLREPVATGGCVWKLIGGGTCALVLVVIALMTATSGFFGPRRTDTKPADASPKADKPASATGQLRALRMEMRLAGQEAEIAFQVARTEEQRQKVVNEHRTRMQNYAARFLDIAEKHPGEEDTVDALHFVLNFAKDTSDHDKALGLLLKEHVRNRRIGSVCTLLAVNDSPTAEKILRAVAATNPEREVQALASLNLAQVLKRKTESPGAKKPDTEQFSKEAEALLSRIEQKYADVNQEITAQAKGGLFELRNLATGKTAPEIEGKDADGKKFRLTDYRGKVVVLEFWAEW